jgi:hypothetical protein
MDLIIPGAYATLTFSTRQIRVQDGISYRSHHVGIDGLALNTDLLCLFNLVD